MTKYQILLINTQNADKIACTLQAKNWRKFIKIIYEHDPCKKSVELWLRILQILSEKLGFKSPSTS